MLHYYVWLGLKDHKVQYTFFTAKTDYISTFAFLPDIRVLCLQINTTQNLYNQAYRNNMQLIKHFFSAWLHNG